ncbi:MAG: hypothetical protein A2046_13400 [Bacteroidetes bacterium GWA2_30_7]|nr:MAG: hypothetical protein A2046_13400 [Bacteroidetes bacterium GWA2_30_7]
MKIIIIHDSYIVRKGLKLLAEECFPSPNIIETSNNEELEDVLENNNSDLIFIKNSLLNVETNILIGKLSIKKQGVKLISLLDNEQVVKNDFVDLYLNIDEEKHELISKISKLYPKSETKNKSVISKREIAIIELVAKGLTNNDIAEKLFLSPHTVVTHRKNISKKLGIKSVSGITIYAILNNIINPNELNQ